MWKIVMKYFVVIRTINCIKFVVGCVSGCLNLNRYWSHRNMTLYRISYVV